MNTDPHVCFCGPCSNRIVELESDIMRKDRTIIALNQEYIELRDIRSELEMCKGDRAELEQYAEIAGELTTQRDRAIQIIINMQDYLRSNGRNFVAAKEFIEEARDNGWAGLKPVSWNGISQSWQVPE